MELSSEDLIFDVHRIYDPVRKTIGGKPIDDSVVQTLAEEARTLEHMLLWDIFMNVMKRDAMETLAFRSKDWDDVKSGKFQLSAIKSLKNLIELFKKGA